jgi:hypothetical protein
MLVGTGFARAFPKNEVAAPAAATILENDLQNIYKYL